MKRSTIKQGDTLPWLARPNTLDAGDPLSSNWECRAGVFGADLAAVIDPFVVSDKYTLAGDEYFIVALTRAQTKALDPGRYLLVIDVRNEALTPPYSDESHVELVVEAQALPTI